MPPQPPPPHFPLLTDAVCACSTRQQDEFLHRTYVPNEKRGVELLLDVAKRMQGHVSGLVSVVGITGGKHNPLGVSKNKFLASKATFRAAFDAHFT